MFDKGTKKMQYTVCGSNQFYPNISCNQFQNYDFSNTKPNSHAYVPIEAQYCLYFFFLIKK